ncbi:MAG: hypothetical protein J3K34DRAFT_428040 [Monoraphidium minutum]|nr:MAG: hypothetical protein J3K34DRAFT_428040 [Monoraphidium minutum]
MRKVLKPTETSDVNDRSNGGAWIWPPAVRWRPAQRVGARERLSATARVAALARRAPWCTVALAACHCADGCGNQARAAAPARWCPCCHLGAGLAASAGSTRPQSTADSSNRSQANGTHGQRLSIVYTATHPSRQRRRRTTQPSAAIVFDIGNRGRVAGGRQEGSDRWRQLDSGVWVAIDGGWGDTT